MLLTRYAFSCDIFFHALVFPLTRVIICSDDGLRYFLLIEQLKTLIGGINSCVLMILSLKILLRVQV